MVEPRPALPGLLIKYIFTGEKLSVQVHPSDVQTLAMGLGRQGKEECWLIVDAESGAKLGIGFDIELSSEAMREAALDGSIEGLLTWHALSPGDFFYIPANTVHAIGAGVSLIEVQQNSDITYRLYDYGRPRELHLDEAVAVARGDPYLLERWHKTVPGRGSHVLVDGPLFLLNQIAGPPSAEIAARYPRAVLVIPRSGEIDVLGENVEPGDCAFAGSLADVRVPRDSVCLLATTAAQFA